MHRRTPALIVLALTLAFCVGCPPDDSGSEADASAAADGGTPDSQTADGATDDAGPGGGDADDPDAGAGDASAATPLVEQSNWKKLPAGEDHLAAHRPASVDCPDSALGEEELQGRNTFTVKTAQCNYLAVGQPLAAPIETGETLNLRVWHFKLIYNAPAEAHVGVLVGGELVWEETVMIPTDSGDLLAASWQAQKAYPAGERVVFHLHNHGDNTWNFVEFSKTTQ